MNELTIAFKMGFFIYTFPGDRHGSGKYADVDGNADASAGHDITAL